MRIYLDHNATTPVHSDVTHAMLQVLRDGFGNPSSVYEEGAAARAQVEAARRQVASLLKADSREIRFTAGATEANNSVLVGLLAPGDHVVTSAIEHPSVDMPLEWLESRGVEITRVSPDEDGSVAASDMLRAVRPETRLVSLIWANNETGAIQPIEAVAEGLRDSPALFHVDATQAVGKRVVDLGSVPVDFLSSSAHKLGGPKGVGALFVRAGHTLPAFMKGGGQERGLRGGTENVAGIVGFGVASQLAEQELGERAERYGQLRDQLWHGLSAKVAKIRWNGSPGNVLTNTLNVEFEDVAGEVVVQALDLAGVAVSAGAACHSGSIEASKVLLAMGRTPTQARASLRFSVGQGVSEGQIDQAVNLVAELVDRTRARGTP